MTQKACSPHWSWKVNGTRTDQTPQSTIRVHPDDLNSVAWLPIKKDPGETPYPNCSSGHLTCQCVFAPPLDSPLSSSVPLHTVILSLSHFLPVVSDSPLEVMECLLAFRTLPSAQPHHPCFLDLHQVVCDSCLPYKFCKRKQLGVFLAAHKAEAGDVAQS